VPELDQLVPQRASDDARTEHSDSHRPTLSSAR
jgi:hypothetical protein